MTNFSLLLREIDMEHMAAAVFLVPCLAKYCHSSPVLVPVFLFAGVNFGKYVHKLVGP